MRARPKSTQSWHRPVAWPRRSYRRHPDDLNLFGDDPTSPLTPLTARLNEGPETRGRHRLSKPRRVLIIAW